MASLAPSAFRSDTLSGPTADRGPPLEVIVHEPLAGARAARAARLRPGARVPLLQARVVQLQADYRGACDQLARMESHASRVRHFEQSSPYHYGVPNLCVSGTIGSGVGATVRGLYCLMLGAPDVVMGPGAAAAGVTGCMIIAGMRLNARCARDFYARQSGSTTNRNRTESRVHRLLHQISQARESLEAARRLEAVDAAIESPALPLELLEIIAGYDPPDPGAAAAHAPSAPASGPRSGPPGPVHPV